MAYATLDSPYLTAETYGAKKKPSLAAFAGLSGGPSPSVRGGSAESYPRMGGPGVTKEQIDASNAANPHAAGAGGSYFAGGFALPGFAAGAGGDPTLDNSRGDTSIDYDPALVQIRASNTRNLGQAQAAALAGRRKTLQDFGDPLLAKSLLGENDPTLASISSDPEKSTSVLARLARTYQDRTKQNDEELNQGNLWYSGYRGNVLKGIAQDRATDEADATSNVNTALAQIGAALLKQQNDAADAEARGVIDAGARGAASGQVPGGDGGGGGGGNAGGDGGPAGADTGPGGFDAAGIDPAIARAMGLTGFHGSQLVPPGPVSSPPPPVDLPGPPADLPADAAIAAFLNPEADFANRVKRYGNR